MADTFLFGPPSRRSTHTLKDATIRDFSGGWNVIDNDLNLTTKFSKELRNVVRAVDGANEVRQGTKLFAECSEFFDKVINIQYYNGYVIAVGSNGVVVAINSVGHVSLIWNDELASKLPGKPDGWVTTTFVSFAIFNGKLIICNGINKPLIVDNGLHVEYLNDVATGSNANTPICKYVVTHGRYLVMAGDPFAPSTVYISNVDTSGTWYGDEAPNDAVNIDLGSRVPVGSQVVRGIGRFRDKLVIAFDEALLPGSLGTYVSSLHTPIFDDAIEHYGCVSHRAIQTVGEDMLFCDPIGVNSLSRALFTGSVRPDRTSQLIDPEIQKTINSIKEQNVLIDDIFSVYDSLNATYLLFIPNAPTSIQRTGIRGFAYRRIEKLKVEAWYEITNWNYTCATRSALKRIFFGCGSEVHVLGSEQDRVFTDFVGSQEMWDDDLPFTDYSGFTPVADINDSGIVIPWVWELPWSDNGNRFTVKHSQYITLDSEGRDRFTVQMYTDGIFKHKRAPGESFSDDTLFTDGKGWDVDEYDPALEMEMVSGDYPGFGAEEFGHYFGGGRTTEDERLYRWPARYKIYKLRLLGDSMSGRKIVSLTMAYNAGSIRRI